MNPLDPLFSSYSFSISHPSRLSHSFLLSIDTIHCYPRASSISIISLRILLYTSLSQKVPTFTTSRCGSLSLPTSSLAFASPRLPPLPTSPGLLSSWTTLRSCSRLVCWKRTPRPSGALSTSGLGQSESRSMRTSGDFQRSRLCVCSPLDDMM